jgi:hypothetical protein
MDVQVRLWWADGRGMDTFASSASAGSVVVSADPLRLAISAYLARFKGISREHTCSDLNVFVIWCSERGVQPLAARRTDVELFVRWMQETRRFKPSTVARRTLVLSGFYRTCVIDGVLDHSPAEHICRRGHRRGHHRLGRGTRPPRPASRRQAHQGGAGPATTIGVLERLATALTADLVVTLTPKAA